MRLAVIATLLMLTGCMTAPDGYEDDWTPDHNSELNAVDVQN
jgi:starvation-inducible outer membrane lipoprotein